MSRRSAFVAASGFAVTALLLSGCSTAAEEPAAEGTLTVATDNIAPLEAAIAAFEAEYPDIEVELLDGGSDYPTFIRTALAAGNAADVIRTFPGAGNALGVVPLDEAGQLVDLNGASWAGELSETQNNLFANDGKLLSVPIGALGLGPVYNDDTLAALGLSIPQTYSEVLELCADAQAAGVVAYSLFLQGGSAIPTYALVASLVYGPNPGFTVEQIAENETFAGSGWERAFEIQQEMDAAGCFNEGPTGTDYNVAFEQLIGGSALATFAFSDTSFIESLAEEGASFSIAAFPTDDSGENYMAVADSSGFGINAASENQENARLFIDFLATAEAQNAYAGVSKGAPSLPNDSFEADSPNQLVVLGFVSSGKTGPWPDQGWLGTKTQDALNEMSQGIFLGTETPESAAEKLDAAFEEDRQAQ
jgi:raffinose/stachyose/melibiose transport system substrate-binding protein